WHPANEATWSRPPSSRSGSPGSQSVDSSGLYPRRQVALLACLLAMRLQGNSGLEDLVAPDYDSCRSQGSKKPPRRPPVELIQSVIQGVAGAGVFGSPGDF